MKKSIIAALMAVVIFSGCAANQKSSSESSKTTKTVSNENSKTPSSATEDDDPRWIDANFFNSKIANITYYSGEDKVNIDPESKTGKKIFTLLKERFGTHEVMPQADMKFPKNWKGTCKRYLSITLDKTCEVGSHDNGKNPAYHLTKYTGWNFPLDGKYQSYFAAIPESDCAYGKLDSSEELLHYINDNCR